MDFALKKIVLSCEKFSDSYINDLLKFGFIYTLNYEIDDFSEANKTCRQITNPHDDDVKGFNFTKKQIEYRKE